MSVVLIPNVSEGRHDATIKALRSSMVERGATVLDTHSDPRHHRTVFTAVGARDQLIKAAQGLALSAALAIDLARHDGRHPRVGALDVCPFVPSEGGGLEEARATALAAADRIAGVGIPVYLYGAAADKRCELPELRRGGLQGLIERAAAGDPPDMGPERIDPSVGVVCVGARDPLIAFNVWTDAPPTEAQRMAAEIRSSGGGLPGVRAIGLDMGDGRSQVSMNLTEPAITSIEEAFEAVDQLAESSGFRVSATEIVGLPPERFMPSPDAKVARLLMQPSHSLESRMQKL